MIKNLFTAGLSIDKWAHFLVGTICGLTVTFFTTNMVLGICAAIAIGALKEWIIDGWAKLGATEAWDFYWTAIGGVVGSITAALIFWWGPVLL